MHEVNYNECVQSAPTMYDVMSKAQKEMLERIKVQNQAEMSERHNSEQQNSKPASVHSSGEKQAEE